jgi:hypothetical protein
MNSAPIPATTWYSIDFFALMMGSTTGEPSNISINPAARLLLATVTFLRGVEIHFLYERFVMNTRILSVDSM